MSQPAETQEPLAAPASLASDDPVIADVAELVGRGRRVLDLGGRDDALARALEAQGCSVVAVAVDAADPFAELRDERFEVVVGVDVLEDAADPRALLTAVAPLVEPAGAIVLAVANVAHASVRLALLAGRVDAAEGPLARRSHFTRERLEQLLDEAELGLAALHRHERGFDAAGAPADVRSALEADPDARTAQFVVRAVPIGQPGLREVQRRLRQHTLALADAQADRARLTVELEQARAQADELGAALAKLAGREGELRRSLIEAHDQLLARESELDEVKLKLELAEGDLEREEQLRKGDQAWSAEQAAALEDLMGQLRAARAEAARYRRTSAHGVAGRLKSLLARARG